MNIDINVIIAKAQARIGELEMQLIIAQSTIELLQAQLAEQEGADHSPEPESEE